MELIEKCVNYTYHLCNGYTLQINIDYMFNIISLTKNDNCIAEYSISLDNIDKFVDYVSNIYPDVNLLGYEDVNIL